MGMVGKRFEHDAYIVYSSEDEERVWVHLTFVQELEKTYGLNLCIEHRNFLGGIDILDNIEGAIKKCRKVIAIVSRSFLDTKKNRHCLTACPQYFEKVLL